MSLSADSVRAAHPAQCQPETFRVSVFGAAKAAVDRPTARATAAMSLVMASVGYLKGPQIQRIPRPPIKCSALRALAVGTRPISGKAAPRSPASPVAVNATYARSFPLPRWGAGGREGQA